jgi:cardiolipin synthase (CMP-forming)
MPINLPNLLTLARILMIPLFLGVFYLPDSSMTASHKNLLGATIFSFAAMTDWFDGYLARKWNQMSAFGAFLDPVADKLMVAAALILLVQLDRADSWFAFIIIGREITISALREWMAKMGASRGVAVSYIGKVKTFMQMAAIILLLLHDDVLPGLSTHLLGTLCLIAAVILTLWSMAYYLRVAWPELARQPRQ